MKKTQQKKLTINRETLHDLANLEQEKLQVVAGGTQFSVGIWTCTCMN